MNESLLATEIVTEPLQNAGSRQIIYEFARANTLEGWWVWALLIGSLAILLFASIRLYRRDTAAMPASVRMTLIGLRVATIFALVFFFFDLQRRTQRLITRPSEVAILVDTSQSMSLPASTSGITQSRAERTAGVLGKTDLLKRLASEHRVSVYAFDEAAEPRLLQSDGGIDPAESVTAAKSMSTARSTQAILGLIVSAIGLALGLSALVIGASGRGGSVGPWLVAASLLLVAGIITTGAVYTVNSQLTLAELVGFDAPRAEPTDSDTPDDEDAPEPIRVTDWGDAIAAAGAQSRIGDAIRSVLMEHDPSTLAGIVVMTDGQNNGGAEASVAVAAARRSEVALYPVGVGSSEAPTNVRVVDLDAPKRVYPSDKFAITAVLQASGARPIRVEVQLLDGLDSTADNTGTNPSDAPGEVVDSQSVEVASDGTLTGIRFELEPESVGRRRLAIRVVAPAEDRNKDDDMRDARYEVVSRKLRVLTVAGGPMREYQFVRNLLFRDQSIELDTWLQTGQPGISQDADRLLDAFPKTAEELFDYDAIIMFDPNWTALTADQLQMLDRWLAQQAGGMILVAGPVYHPQWSRLRTDPRVSIISGFFPVNLSTRGPLLDGGRQGGQNAWPLQFTPEARRAEFLWISEDPQRSFDAWEESGGVYDFVGVKSAKPASKVYAYFSDPTTEVGGSSPVYMASQFYGAGRVYFQGSGEMWRLRGVSDALFDSYWTKLVRFVSEGRLLRDSNRGLLLVDNSRAMVGDTIAVRAVLTDEQFEPLDVAEVPAKLLAPGGRIEDMKLLPLKGEPRAGTYGGRFVVREAGSYEIRLTLGDALAEQVLRQSVQVRLPTVELERPRRNDAELTQIAAMTGGSYLPLDDDISADQVATNLVAAIRPQPQTTVLPGTPDRDFGRRRNGVLMWLIATLITFEWVTRRLHRLA